VEKVNNLAFFHILEGMVSVFFPCTMILAIGFLIYRLHNVGVCSFSS
jgi:hypothetical protein